MATNTYKQAFKTELEKQMRADNAFLSPVKDVSSDINNSMVNMYYEGADPNYSINLGTGSLPVSITERTDGVFNFSVDEILTDVTLVRRNDENKTTYNKKASVRQQHAVTVSQAIAEYAIYNWLRNYAGTDGDTGANIPAGQKILTSGAAATGTDYNNPALDGLRKKMSVLDIQKAQLIFDRSNMPRSKRYALLPAQMYHEVFNEDNIRYIANQGGNLKISADYVEMFGFKIYMRSTAGLTTSGTVQAPGSAITTATDHTAIFYHADCVNKGMGTLDVFPQTRGEYAGDLYNVRQDFASHRHRNDALGVVTLTQAPTV